MIITTKNSDYSATGLGKLESLNAKTIALLTATGRLIPTSKKQALESFLKTIGFIDNNGIYAKTQLFFMPCLANSLANSFYNLSANAIVYPSGYNAGNIGTSEYLFDSTAFGLSNTVTPVYPFKVGTYANTLSSNNFFALSYCPTSTNKHPIHGTSSVGFGGKKLYSYNNVSNLLDVREQSATLCKLSLLNCTSLTVGGAKMYLDSVQKTPSTEIITGTPTAISLNNSYLMARGDQYSYDNCLPTQIIMIGSALTDLESTTLNTAVTTFISVLNS